MLNLIRSGLIIQILGEKNVNGFLIVYEKISIHKALRRLESRILTYRVELERNPDNLRARHRLELLEYAYKDLSRLADPIQPTLLLLFSDDREVDEMKKRLTSYNCKLKRACGFLLNKGSIIVSSKSLLTMLVRLVGYKLSLGMLANNYEGVLIGYEHGSKAPVLLPVLDREIGSLHTLIVGPSGRGKTTLLARIVFENCINEASCAKIIDPKGDLIRLVKRGLQGCRLTIYDRDEIDSLNDAELFSWPQNCQQKIIVSDEAWRLLDRLGAGYSILARSARSSRISLILASQQPEDFPLILWNNSHNFIVFGSSSPRYVESVSKLADIPEDIASKLLNMGVGEAIIKHFGSISPIFFRVLAPPPITVKNPEVDAGRLGSRVLSYGQTVDNPA